jgi:hypothetical protein
MTEKIGAWEGRQEHDALDNCGLSMPIDTAQMLSLTGWGIDGWPCSCPVQEQEPFKNPSHRSPRCRSREHSIRQCQYCQLAIDGRHVWSDLKSAECEGVASN